MHALKGNSYMLAHFETALRKRYNGTPAVIYQEKKNTMHVNVTCGRRSTSSKEICFFRITKLRHYLVCYNLLFNMTQISLLFHLHLFPRITSACMGKLTIRFVLNETVPFVCSLSRCPQAYLPDAEMTVFRKRTTRGYNCKNGD